MLSNAERASRYRARQRGEPIPKLRPGPKTNHLDKAIQAVLSAADHINRLSANELEEMRTK